MNKLLTILKIDLYKLLHKDQYPDNVEIIFSHLTPRGTKIKYIDSVTSFGIKIFLEDLTNGFEEDFFSLTHSEVKNQLLEFEKVACEMLNLNTYDTKH